jgi:hypothetical protein
MNKISGFLGKAFVATAVPIVGGAAIFSLKHPNAFHERDAISLYKQNKIRKTIAEGVIRARNRTI